MVIFREDDEAGRRIWWSAGLIRDEWMGLLHFDGRCGQFPFHRVPGSDIRLAFGRDEAVLVLGFFAFGLCFPHGFLQNSSRHEDNDYDYDLRDK